LCDYPPKCRSFPDL